LPRGYPKDGKKRRLSPATRCAICRHPDRPRIEALRCAGVSLDKLAEQFNVHRDAIWRHMEKHVPDERKASYLIGAGKIAQLAEVAAEESQSVLDYFTILRSALFAMFDKLAEKGDHASASAVSARLVEVLKEIGRLTGQISTIAAATTINVQNNYAVINSAPFADLQTGLLEVCARHPDARADIIDLIERLDAKYRAMPPSPMKTIGASPVLEARP